jgi:hypothetical protein
VSSARPGTAQRAIKSPRTTPERYFDKSPIVVFTSFSYHQQLAYTMNNRDCRPLFRLHLVTIGGHFADKLMTTTQTQRLSRNQWSRLIGGSPGEPYRVGIAE